MSCNDLYLKVFANYSLVLQEVFFMVTVNYQ